MQWDHILTPLLIAIIVPAVLAALSRAGALAPANPGQLGSSAPVRWFSLVLSILPTMGFLLLGAFAAVRPSDRIALLATALLFPALTGPLILEFFRVNHRFDDNGITYRSPWTRHRHVAWSDVAVLRW